MIYIIVEAMAKQNFLIWHQQKNSCLVSGKIKKCLQHEIAIIWLFVHSFSGCLTCKMCLCSAEYHVYAKKKLKLKSQTLYSKL